MEKASQLQQESKKGQQGPFFSHGEKTATPFFDGPESTTGKFIQAKLTINQPGDAYEQEADQVAEKVVSAAPGKNSVKASQPPAVSRKPDDDKELQRKCAACEEDEQVQRKPITPSIQRAPTDAGSQVSADTASRITASKGSGAPLPTGTKSFMESSFGTDFSGVNVHTNDKAASLSKDLNAQAFTTGNDIFFNSGKFAPETTEGNRLLAHELTHVVQQGGSNTSIQRQTLPWSTRVSSAQSATGAAKDTAFITLMTEALGAGVTVHSATNTAASIDAAITAGNYTAWDAATMTINFDANFNGKTGIGANQYGDTIYKTNNGTTVYIVMGPNCVQAFGPAYTQMANAHEQSHARDFTSQGTNVHAATAAEELTIYTQGFVTYFLSLVTLDTAQCSFDFGESFNPLFDKYTSSAQADRDTSFNNIQTFYTGTISGNADNVLKFKIWLQDRMNSRSATDALVTRLNTTLSLGLTRGTNPITLISGCQP